MTDPPGAQETAREGSLPQPIASPLGVFAAGVLAVLLRGDTLLVNRSSALRAAVLELRPGVSLTEPPPQP